MSNAFNLRVRPLDVGGAVARGVSTKNTMADLKERGRLRDANAAFADSMASGIPTDPAARQQLVSQAAQVNPQAAFDTQTYLNNMDSAKRDRMRQEAAIRYNALKDVQNPDDYGVAVGSLKSVGIDAPPQYNPQQVHQVLRGAQALMEPGEGFTLSQGQQRFGSDGAPIASVAPKSRLLSQAEFDQQKEIRAAGKSTSNINMPTAEKEEQKARGKRLDATAGTIQEKASAAQDTLAQLSIAKTLDVRTGGLAPLKKWAASYAEAFGSDPSVWGLESATSAEAFEGIMNNMVLTKMQAQKGPQTENDAARIEQTLANLRNTPEANKFLFRSAEALARRDLEQARFFEDHYAKNRTYDGALRAWDQFKRETPLLATDPDTGQTIFFSEFERGVMRANRGATRDQVIEFWRSEYGQ